MRRNAEIRQLQYLFGSLREESTTLVQAMVPTLDPFLYERIMCCSFVAAVIFRPEFLFIRHVKLKLKIDVDGRRTSI
jgi:hypothetical protein